MDLKRSDLAEALGITPRRVTNFTTSGQFKYSRKGFYDLKECINAYVEYQVETLMKQNTTPKNISSQEETLNYWKMIRAKNAALKEMGITMKVEDAESLMSSRLEQIRNVLNTIDTVWAPYMVGLKTTEDSQKMLSRQLDVLFEALSTLEDFEMEEVEVSEIELEEDDDEE